MRVAFLAVLFSLAAVSAHNNEEDPGGLAGIGDDHGGDEEDGGGVPFVDSSEDAVFKMWFAGRPEYVEADGIFTFRYFLENNGEEEANFKFRLVDYGNEFGGLTKGRLRGKIRPRSTMKNPVMVSPGETLEITVQMDQEDVAGRHAHGADFRFRLLALAVGAAEHHDSRSVFMSLPSMAALKDLSSDSVSPFASAEVRDTECRANEECEDARWSVLVRVRDFASGLNRVDVDATRDPQEDEEVYLKDRQSISYRYRSFPVGSRATQEISASASCCTHHLTFVARDVYDNSLEIRVTGAAQANYHKAAILIFSLMPLLSC